MVTITTYGSEHFSGVDALWRDAFPNDSPWNVAAVAIPEKIRAQPNLFLVAIEGPLVVGSVMAGYDGHRGWISRIAVLRSHWRKGILAKGHWTGPNHRGRKAFRDARLYKD